MPTVKFNFTSYAAAINSYWHYATVESFVRVMYGDPSSAVICRDDWHLAAVSRQHQLPVIDELPHEISHILHHHIVSVSSEQCYRAT